MLRRNSSLVFLRQLSLAYKLHEPHDIDRKNWLSPLIFLHGLFGSKENMGSLSKSVRLGFVGRTSINGC